MKERTYLTVTALNKYIERKFLLDPYLEEIYIKGEISNFKIHNNNNIYFSIKDENTRINAVWFGAKNFEFKGGDTVLIKSKINYYFPRGEHNLLVIDMKKDRIGELYQKFLELKEKLDKEGLFSSLYKKQIPKLSANIGVVTAETGAAIQDIKRTIMRRFPLANINLYSTLVQGENSVQDIVKNIKLADNGDNDVIILARGGGSIEDLWSFNTEEVVRAIFNCNTPIVTGVGHETDITLADFVSDMRASTPTAAAEIVTPNIEDIKNKLKFNLDKLNNRIKFILESSKACIVKNKENPYIKNYLNIYLEYKRNLEATEKNLQRILNAGIKEKKIDFFYKKEEFLDIDILEKYKENFAKTIEHLEANSPINIMKKGYSITFLEDKKVTSVKEIKPKDNATVQLLDGVFTCEVKEVLKEGVK
ncbi:exodeoxyribonuclease VII large subunit [Gemella sp. oral taxon 928]|uniref:exodeoxyribonuclease VII large subunit n=1 Tax=Gemella sp. oral taxon 928 TaxID=1785995 RepID=UPI0007684D3C|nr:exodeoxyribonuclease VII large subunit [Gemella sp. oral taxon 928]AME09618.1 exodeoxyribonuclease VII large subunit [Gemella sp. oral taxon 928]